MSIILKVIFIFLITVYFCVCHIQHHKHVNFFNITYFLAACLYVFDVLSITIINRPVLEEQRAVLVPCRAYISILRSGWVGEGQYIMREIVGNVIMFVPLGMILNRFLRTKGNYIVIGCLAFFFSIIIELTQYYYCIGTFEMDDLLHNVWGAVIGGSIYRVVQHYNDKQLNTRIFCRDMIPAEAFAAAMFMVCAWPIVRSFIV